MSHIYQNITELIGQTPIVKLNNLVPEGAAEVYVKLEAFNPGSSGIVLDKIRFRLCIGITVVLILLPQE